jgi:RNA polymerase sigma-54 factor
MSSHISLQQTGKQKQSLKQMHRLIMSSQMQQALNLLQLPTLELTPLIEAELECNPILEHGQEITVESDDEIPENEADLAEKELILDDQHFEMLKELDEEYRDQIGQETELSPYTKEDDRLKTYQESLIQEIPTLFNHLMDQAKNTFEDAQQLKMAEILIGNFDDRGFLDTPLEDIAQIHRFNLKILYKVLSEIQAFEPYGVGAANLQQSLLIQMRCRAKRNTLAYQIIEHHYDDLIHNRVALIQKSLKCTKEQIHNAVQHQISKLDLHPGGWYSRDTVQAIVPDVSIREENNQLIPEINDDSIPNLYLNRQYLRMLEDKTIPQETKEFIKEKLGSAKWLMRNLFERNKIIMRIATYLTEKQREFLINPNGRLHPMTMKQMAEELEVHESTIARAVSNKYIETPRGLLLLRSFFTNGYETKEGYELSSSTIRDLLTEMIKKEDKKKPLSDQVLSNRLKEKGIDCARRTVAKYRTLLNIGTALQRKQFS